MDQESNEGDDRPVDDVHDDIVVCHVTTNIVENFQRLLDSPPPPQKKNNAANIRTGIL